MTSIEALFARIAKLAILITIATGPTARSQTVVNSISGLLPYLDDDNVNVVMTPGTYRITADEAGDDSFSFPEPTLLSFTGNNSTFDFTGVTIEFETGIFRKYGNVDVKEVALWGDDLVLKNLTMVDIGNSRPQRTALGMLIDGNRNLVEGFDMTIRGSYPYGYGDLFGKGSGYVIKHFKHSAILVRGNDNHLKDTKIFHRAYGHGIFCQGSIGARIEGCYVEGEMRSTDEVLAEAGTGSHADLENFLTVWGWDVPPGNMFCLQEDGIRAYNTGSGPDGVTRNTRDLEVIDCTVKNMRSGVTIGFCDNTKYVENCVALGCENGYWVGSGGQIVDSAGDVAHGRIYTNSYQNDSNSTVDLTILESENPYGNDVVAYVGGSGHNITLRHENPNPDQSCRILVGGPREGMRFVGDTGFTTNNITLNNLTNFPVILHATSSNTGGQSGGPVTDNGSSNSLGSYTVNSCGGFSALSTIEAEDHCAQSGTTTAVSNDNHTHIASAESGDWLRFDDFFLGDGPLRFEARIAGGQSSGNLEIRLGSTSGTLIGTCPLSTTADGRTWVTATTTLTKTTGKHDLYLVYTGGSGTLPQLDSFKFSYWDSNRDDRDPEHLVGHWKFDEGTANFAADSSGNGHHGTNSGATWVTGVEGNALDFDGGSDQVIIPASAFDTIGEAITISMWIYGDGSQPLVDSAFYAQSSSSGRALNIHLPYDNSEVYWDAGSNNNYDRINDGVASDQYEGRWNHWVFTKNTTDQTMTAYHNGAIHLSGISKNQSISDIAEAAIGGRVGTSGYHGVIDEVKLYDTALSEKEVISLLQSYPSNSPPTAIDSNFSVREDALLPVSLTGSDPDLDYLNFNLLTAPTSGTLIGTPPNLHYQANPGFTGNDSFTFEVSDGEFSSTPGTVTIDVTEGQLLAHWRLDELGGSFLADSSGNGHHATMADGTWVTALDGGGVDFDGINDSVILPASAFGNITDQLTVSLWIFGDQNPPREDSVFYAEDGSGERMLNVHLPWENSQVYWDAGNSSGYDRMNKSASLEDYHGQWNHWAFSKDVTTGVMSIYLNGQLWDSAPGKTKPLTGITAATLGSQIAGAAPYTGTVDDLRLFNYALTDEEIAGVYRDALTPDAFDSWLAAFGSLSDLSRHGDPDGDGIPTLLEFVLNGSPQVPDVSILPTCQPSGDDFVFTFDRRIESIGNAVQTLQYSTSLDGGWVDVPIDDPFSSSVSLGAPVGGVQTVTVTLSGFLASNPRLFCRLMVE